MKFIKSIPGYTKYIFTNVLILFIYTAILRWIFYMFFAHTENSKTIEIAHAYALGTRFDIKLSVLVVFPIAILIFIINNRFFLNKIFKKISRWYFVFTYIIITLFYIFDFGYYDYLTKRIDASSLRFLEDFAISFQVLIESYPVFKGFFAILVFTFFIYKLTGILYEYFAKNTIQYTAKKKAFYIIIPLFLLAFGIYNSITHYPLRWSQAFFSKNNNINQFALNPVLYFFDSFKFRSEGFNLEKTKNYYPKIADVLGFPKDTLLFERKFFKNDSITTKPNIIIIMMESVGVVPLSYYGNPIHTTPKIDSIIKQSINFSNFYVHKAGTAGSVFASVTGLPDVDGVKTASRNPMVINQRIVFDQFKGYEKFYFLGGSANWANIRGIFQSNITNLHIFEEGSYGEEKRADVWGIDDYELFKEANKELEKVSKKPFIAYIQTATNHMPFTVPNKKESYKPLTDKDISKETLTEAGFDGIDRLNALRYLDFNIGKFLNRAKKSGYYDNTIFLFFGDHNTHMLPTKKFKKEFDLGTQVHHVPFFIHAPKLLKPQEITAYRKLVDVVPTAASLANISYTNYTLGSNAINTATKNNFAFLYQGIDGEPGIAIIKDSLYFAKTTHSGKLLFYDLRDKEKVDVSSKFPDKKQELDSLNTSFYEATKYLYYNNKKK